MPLVVLSCCLGHCSMLSIYQFVLYKILHQMTLPWGLQTPYTIHPPHLLMYTITYTDVVDITSTLSVHVYALTNTMIFLCIHSNVCVYLGRNTSYLTCKT